MEIWKSVAGFEGTYEVSNTGRVRRLPITYTNSLGITKSKKDIYYLKINLSKKGYPRVDLCLMDKGKKKSCVIHRLVAEAFLIDFCKDLQVDHLDCDKTNNDVNNLEMVTLKENMSRSHRYGSHSKVVEKPALRKFSELQILNIKSMYRLVCHKGKKVNSQRALAKAFNCSQDTIKKIVNNQSWYDRHRI